MAKAATIGRIGALATAIGLAAAACAQDQPGDSGLKSIAKSAGFATDVGPPADFVLRSRPDAQSDYIPVFRPPEEPPRAALSAAEQKAIAADLGATAKRAAARVGAKAKRKPKPEDSAQ